MGARSVVAPGRNEAVLSDLKRRFGDRLVPVRLVGDADYDSETRFALDWFAAKGFEKGRSGDAITMTNAVDVSLDGVKGAGFFEATGGDASLLKREELRDNWDPSGGTVWEACQHLIKRLTAEDGGIAAAGRIQKGGSLGLVRFFQGREQQGFNSRGIVHDRTP